MVKAEDLALNQDSQTEIADKNNSGSATNMKIFESFAAMAPSGKKRRCIFRFLEGPVRIDLVTTFIKHSHVLTIPLTLAPYPP